MAGKFRVSQQDASAVTNQDWSLTVTCPTCPANLVAWFYVRAYGPAILTGTVDKQGNSNDYVVTIHPIVAGQYTVEVVLTYSDAIDPERFPLSQDQLPPPPYEGYLLAGFPLQLTVEDTKKHHFEKVLCTPEQLIVDPQKADEVWKRAAWRVVATNKQNVANFQEGRNVTLRGYQWGHNSLGFTASYDYTDCLLIQELPVNAKCVNNKPLHIILIGDSVMRLQKDYLKEHVSEETAQITFVELFGGALRSARLSGPNVTDLQAPVQKLIAQNTIVIFNTGMHDIHRLCGHTWIEDRPEYLTAGELQLPCTTMYRTAIRELAKAVKQIPAAVRIFQTTTAAWPKYGNFGVAWNPRYGQELPLDAAFAERFNQIAVDEIYHLNKASSQSQMISITDAYWITLARPDNRETNQKADIGKKLSHPGREVVSYMVRIWWQIALQLFCPL
jgi:hypothetical protein